MSDPLIQLRGVTKVYRRDQFEIPVLEGIDLDIAEGEFVALMGPSGSGKSTLLNLMAGVDSPTSGRIVVAGSDIAQLGEGELAPWRHRNVGFIFQFYNLIPVLTARENVELPLKLASLSRQDRRLKVETALELVGLADRMDHYPKQLSGGQKQRVAIARALVTAPTFLLADEPTGDLDAASASDVLDLLGQLNQEFQKTTVMVTHDPRAAERARVLYHLEKGQLQREHTGAV
ncbi:MAG: ABC transporter ATP-binding protein [Candidatus Eisenbacteria bacterium]|uniref:ABC transporter ATP-binding protein n=1 Tax=Eiseniibacteriota bacterium TaxID=2212470 RepID=A0A956RN92_UNCEI|nr:ABC transporter ATP-binding protein [Candidatus Eisenbacteria bacterium]